MSQEKRELDDLPELPDDIEMTVPSDLPELPSEVEMTSASAAREPAPEDLPELPELDPEPIAELEPVPAHEPAPAVEPLPEPIAELEPVAAPAEPEPVELVPIEPASAPEPVPTPEQVELVPEPQPEPEPAAAAPTPAPASLEPLAAATSVPGEKPPLRVLDKAPAHLRTAAKIVAAGALIPFMRVADETVGQGWAVTLAAKAAVLLAAWVWMRQILHNWGPSLGGFLGRLADFHVPLKFGKKKAEPEGKVKRRASSQQGVQTLEHPFPSGLHLLSLALVVLAVFLAAQDPRSGPIGPVGPAEMGIFGWAAFTIVHITGYERWGRFSPLFPLMFLGMLFSGVASVFAGLGQEERLLQIASIAGGAIVAAGGGMAAYTIVEAMLSAKKEGDRKKAQSIEARKAARKTRRSS